MDANEPVEPDKMISEIRQEPYSLPGGFVWDAIDLNNSEQVCDISPFTFRACPLHYLERLGGGYHCN